MPTVSVVLPVKNSEATIGATVAALLGQDYGGTVELIVVGPAGDRTWDALGAELQSGAVRALEIELPPGRDTPAVKRNIGLARARGEVLGLCDSDVVPAANWVSTGVALLRCSWDVVAGPIESIEPGYWGLYVDANRLASKTPRMDAAYRLDADSFGRWRRKPPVTANVLVNRATFEDTGGFDETFTFAYEDYDWFRRIVDRGHLILCTRLLAARHHHRRGFRPLIGEYLRSGRGCAQYLRSQPHCRLSLRRGRQLVACYGAALASAALAVTVGPVVVAAVAAACALVLALASAAAARRAVAVTFPLTTFVLGSAFVAGLTRGLLERPRTASVAPAQGAGPSARAPNPWARARLLFAALGASLRRTATALFPGALLQGAPATAATPEVPPLTPTIPLLELSLAEEPARAGRHRSRGEALALAGVVGVAALLRFWQLSGRPGFEVDEPVYTHIAASVAASGRLLGKPVSGLPNPPYLYHPPFYFLLLGGWFSLVGSGIAKARLLAAGMSLITLALLYGCCRRFLGRAALLPVVLVATDGWIVYSSRISWMENTLMVLGVGAIWLYGRAVQTRRIEAYLAAGVCLGAAVVFKHVAGYLVLAVLLHWALIRRDQRQHLVMLGAAVAVACIYLVGMTLAFGHVYWQETGVQFDRTLGIGDVRGTVSTLGQAARAVLGQYGVFYVTILSAALGIVLVFGRAVQALRIRSLSRILEHSVLYAWAAAAIVFFAAIQLHFSNYFVMILIPLYAYISAELVGLLRRRPPWRPAAYATLAAVLVANLATFMQRIAERHDNALVAVSRYASAQIPSGALVVTEEYVANMIPQPYCPSWRASACAARADYVITYTSRTERPPPVPALYRLIASSTPLATFTGFKERIVVYRIRRTSAPRTGFSPLRSARA